YPASQHISLQDALPISGLGTRDSGAWQDLLVARAEQGGADADHGRTFGNGQLSIVAHAHGQRVDTGVLRAQRVEQCAHAGEGFRSEEHTSELQSRENLV